MREGESPGEAGQTPTEGDPPKALTPSRYLAWLYSTDAQKPVLAALLDIEAEIASGLRPGIEHHVAHARLQWWSEEAERVREARPVHPLARELVKARANAGNQAPAASTRAMPLTEITGFVDTGVWDLARATFETRKELAAYCERWATAIFETAASTVARGVPGPAPANREHAGAADPAHAAAPAPSSWKIIGAAVREIELLADLAREAHVGRIRLPLDELDRAGVDANTIAKLPWSAQLATLLQERHETLRATVANGVAALPRAEQTALRGLLVWVALTSRLSVRAQRALPNVVLPGRYDVLADGWQAWRAARRASAGRLRLT